MTSMENDMDVDQEAPPSSVPAPTRPPSPTPSPSPSSNTLTDAPYRGAEKAILQGAALALANETTMIELPADMSGASRCRVARK
jgi:hypothetical protein